MSLTSEISNPQSKISQYFSKYFNFSNFISDTNKEIQSFYTLAPSQKANYPWSDIGHMTEYMLLLYMGLEMQDLFPMRFAKTSYQKYYKDTLSKYSDINSCFKDRNKFHNLCNDLYRMSKIEGHFRSGKAISNNELNNLIVTDVMLQDMINIHFKSLAVNPVINNSDNVFNYNPTFDLSAAVGGADADLYLIKPNGNFLIDLKTTIRPSITTDMIHQLIGYVFLDESNKHNLTEIGVYLTRQNLISCWKIDYLINDYSKFKTTKDAKEEFRKTVLEALFETNFAPKNISKF